MMVGLCDRWIALRLPPYEEWVDACGSGVHPY
jgi:hypothetical protein